MGKSTLFNRLTESRKAIVDPTSGVTRDRHYGKSDWAGKEFTIIDTGGYITGSDDVFEEEIRKQVKLAVEEANLIIFLTDVTEGITDIDQEIAHILRSSGKKVFLVVNKVDNFERLQDASEFYAFGFGDYFAISSVTGSGTGELLDEVVKNLPNEPIIEDEIQLPKISVIGRPNVGKSSFVNALLNETRNIVTDIAGTTRDSINTHYKAYGHDLILIDTAGIRKKSKVHEDLEFYSVMRSIRAIEDADVCFLMIDANIGIDSQDLNLFHVIQNNRKGVVILVNKWDLVEKQTNSTRDYEVMIREKIAPFKDVPILFISALTKQRILKAIETAMEVYKNRTQRIPTRKFNDIMLPIVEGYPPPAIKGKYIKIKFATQLPTLAPSFAFFCNLPQYINEPYKRFLENKLREEFNFSGVPIQIFFRKK